MDKMANVTFDYPDYQEPDGEEYRHRVEAGYVVMGFIIGVFLLLIIFLVYITRNELKIQMKRMCRSSQQVEVQSPKLGNNYQYLEGYNGDGVKLPYL